MLLKRYGANCWTREKGTEDVMNAHDIYTMLFGMMIGGSATFAVVMVAGYYWAKRR